MNLLEVRNLKVHFPVKHGVFSRVNAWVKAVDDVSLTVAPGETVWSIAKALNSNGDLRQLVDQIIIANGLQSADVTAGSKIRVPLK